ncbi:MAG: TonB-dependent receptor [Sphingomonadales bacterium]
MLGAFAAGPAQAQDEQPSAPAPTFRKAPEQVLVTARRKEEALIEVPVAVTALGSAELERYNSGSFRDIATQVPNLEIADRSAGSYAEIFLRGVGSGGIENGFEQAVTFNLDGVSIARGAVGIQGMFDLEAVEVLKGPQSLFFGKNSSAGVISLRSRGPADEFEGFLRAGYEFRADEYAIEGGVSIPITDYLGMRVAFRLRDMRGYVKNNAQPVISPVSKINGGQMPGALHPYYGEEDYLGRITVEYDSGGPFTASLKVFGSQHNDDGPTTRDEVVFCGPDHGMPGGGHNQFEGTANNRIDPYQDCELDLNTAVSAIPINDDVKRTLPQVRDGDPYNDLWSIYSSLTMNYEADDFTVTSITGYMYYNIWTGHASGNSSYTPIPVTIFEDFEQISQEIRFASGFDSPFNFVVGGYYEKSELGVKRNLFLFHGPQDPVTGAYQDFNFEAGTDGDAISAYGQLIWDITDNIELAGGARWSRETKKSFMTTTYVNPAFTAIYLPVGMPFIPTDYKDSNVSPEVTLSYHPIDEFMVYAAYKTGYKSGGHGIGTFPIGLSDASVGFDAEKAEGFEVGWKLVTPGNALQITGAAYHYIYSNLQVSSYDAGTNSFNLNNAAKASTTGVEVQGMWQASDELQVRGSAAYNRAKYEDFPNSPCYSGRPDCTATGADLSGDPLAHAPKWIVTAGFSYDMPVSNSLGLEFAADMKYSSGYFAFSQLQPESFQKSFAKVDATIRLYDLVNDHWEFAIIGRNLTNKLTLTNAANSVGGAFNELSGTPSRPREIWLRATGRF